MTAPMEPLAEIVELAAEVGRQAAKLERLAMAAIVDQRQRARERWTQTGVSGCVSPPSLEASPDVETESFTQPADASDSSAAIPPEVVEKIARGGE